MQFHIADGKKSEAICVEGNKNNNLLSSMEAAIGEAESDLNLSIDSGTLALTAMQLLCNCETPSGNLNSSIVFKSSIRKKSRTKLNYDAHTFHPRTPIVGVNCDVNSREMSMNKETRDSLRASIKVLLKCGILCSQ